MWKSESPWPCGRRNQPQPAAGARRRRRGQGRVARPLARPRLDSRRKASDGSGQSAGRDQRTRASVPTIAPTRNVTASAPAKRTRLQPALQRARRRSRPASRARAGRARPGRGGRSRRPRPCGAARPRRSPAEVRASPRTTNGTADREGEPVLREPEPERRGRGDRCSSTSRHCRRSRRRSAPPAAAGGASGPCGPVATVRACSTKAGGCGRRSRGSARRRSRWRLALPAVWWEPLHADEIVTLRFARESPVEIVREHLRRPGRRAAALPGRAGALTWPDGLAGLRIPSIVFFLLALPGGGARGRPARGRARRHASAARARVRPARGRARHVRAHVLALSWRRRCGRRCVALWAARRDSLLGWTLGGNRRRAPRLHAPRGADLLGAGRRHRAPLRSRAVPAARQGRLACARLALGLVQVPYYAFAVGVLRDRYEVELGAPRAQAIGAAGRSVAGAGPDRPRPR